MARIQKFEDIESWQMARQLAKEIYAVTKDNLNIHKDKFEFLNNMTISISQKISAFIKYLELSGKP